MRLGLFTDALADRPLDEVLDWLDEELPQIKDLEIGIGGYSPAPHRDDLRTVEARGYRVAALNASGNPLADSEHDRALWQAIAVARRTGTRRVVCMSGGDPRLSGGAWFPGLEDEIERHWQSELLPYWGEVALLAEHAGVQLCFELEPGSAAFNTSSFERLAAISPAIALNLDPSHFFWQQIDTLAVVRRVGGRIGWAHGKDTVVDPERVALDGLLDRGTWHYAAVGSERGVEWWRSLAQALAVAGYDEVVSIEVEDPTRDPEDALVHSAHVLVEALATDLTDRD